MSGLTSHPPARTARLWLAAGALLALALAGCAAGVRASPSWFVPALVPLVFAGHLLATSRRPSDAGLLGPLFFYDVVRLARRGRSTALRCVYALTLLSVLCVAYAVHFPRAPLFDLSSVSGPGLPLRDLPRFAQAVSLALLLAQAVAVLVLTPAYVAGAITEEKERGTLELLFTSHLSDREMVVGKLLARLAHVGGVFLAGLPVLSLTLLWGGVSAPTLLACFAAVGATLFSVGGLSVLCSALSRHSLSALAWSYVLVAAFSLCALCSPLPVASSPVAFVMVIHDQLANRAPPLALMTPGASVVTLTALDVTNLFVGLHLLIGWACVALAVRQLRVAALAEGAPTVSPSRLVPVSAAIEGPAGCLHGPEAPVSHLEPGRAAPLAWRPAGDRSSLVGDRPLLWKEMFKGGPFAAGPSPGQLFRRVGAPWLLDLLVVGAVTLAAYGGASTQGRRLSASVSAFCHPVAVLLAGGWCTGVAFRAAAAVSRERERGTLDGLLSLPVGRRAILRAKWLGSILRGRGLGYCLAGLWSFGLVTGGLHPLALPMSALACAVGLALAASVGLWLSVVASSTRRATVYTAVLGLLWLFGPWLASPLAGPPVPVKGRWPGPLDWLGCNPLGAWWVAQISWVELSARTVRETELFHSRLAAVFVGLAVQAAAAGVLCLLAVRSFRSAFGR